MTTGMRSLHEGGSDPRQARVQVLASDWEGQAPQLEQPRCICTGGHLTEPYEQNTQQSPAFGRNTVLQRSHS